MTERTIVPIKSKRKRSPTKAIEYRKTLKDIFVDKGQITLIIIPSFSFETQDDQFLDNDMLMALMTRNNHKKVRNIKKYCKRIQEIAKLLEEVKENINRFFVAQNTITTTDWLNDLLLTYNSLKGLSTFPHEYPQTIPRLWYSQKENSKMEIVTEQDFFWDLTKGKDGKFINILFLHNKRRNWIKNFFKGMKVKQIHILPTIPLLLLSPPK